jgi:cystathionine gamma-lyase
MTALFPSARRLAVSRWGHLLQHDSTLLIRIIPFTLKSSNFHRTSVSKLADMENFKPFPHFATDVIHEGQEPEQWNSMAVIPPLSTSTTFKQYAPGEHTGFEYSRSGNPTRNCLEKCLAASEGAKHGLCFASGLAATTTITYLLKSGDHIISMDDIYGGTNRLFRKCSANMGIDISFVDLTNAQAVVEHLKPTTKMIWIETPTNPTMKLVDIRAICQIVKAEVEDWPEKPFVVVDNTFMSAYFQRPLELGADIVMHSLSKYMNGHSDVIMGAVLVNDEALVKRLRFFQNALGAVPSPFDCYLVSRGMKTLAVRMKEHMKNGLAVAKFLEAHPAVEKVVHPGLHSHPQYELGKKQMVGYSGMLIFFIKGGLQEARTFLKSVKVFTLAESLGGFESLCELPSLQTHASVPEEQRQQLGITDTLIRLSVGLEDIDDLIQDLDQALNSTLNLSKA